MSERVADASCLAFAAWTLCSHAVVGLGGSLDRLLALFALVAGAALATAGALAWRRRRRGTPAAAAAASPEPLPPHPAALRASQAAGLAAGVACVSALLAGAVGPVGFWWSATLLLAAAAVLFVLRVPVRPEPAAAGGVGRELGLWALAAACVAVTLVVHRPDLDDSFYVNLAVAAADAPDRPLLAHDTLHGIESLPIMLPVYRLHSFELLVGAVSRVTGIPGMPLFHLGAAALGALLVPLAHARLFRLLTPQRWLWSTAALVFVLLAAGETHRWYGNFAFVRMWQGKAVYLFVFMPLVYAYALGFALRPTVRSWLLLAAAQIGAVGASSSALWAAPAGSLMALCCVLRPGARGLRVFGMGSLASAYVLIAGALAKQQMTGGGYGPSLRQVYQPGQRLLDALQTFLGEAHLFAFGLLVLTAAWACCRRGLAQRFAIVTPLAVLVVLLNPYIDRWVVANLTGGSYWRGLWSLPLPILMALVLTAPLSLRRLPAARVTGPAASLALAAAFALYVPQFSALSPHNAGAGGVGIRIGSPGLKVPEQAWRWATALNDAAPPGSRVVAPHYVSVWVPTQPGAAHPIAVRGFYLREIKRHVGPENARLRQLMMNTVNGASEHPDAARQFAIGLDSFHVRAVCLRNTPQAVETRRILRAAGFHRTLSAIDHEIWVR